MGSECGAQSEAGRAIVQETIQKGESRSCDSGRRPGQQDAEPDTKAVYELRGQAFDLPCPGSI